MGIDVLARGVYTGFMTLTIQQKGGMARWKGISPKQRSKIMKKVRSGAKRPKQSLE